MFDSLPEWASRFHFQAHSPSSLARPDDYEFVEKVIARPAKIYNPPTVPLIAGSAAHEYVEDVLCKGETESEAFRNAMVKLDGHDVVGYVENDRDKTDIIRNGVYEHKDTIAGTVFENTLRHLLEGCREAATGANIVEAGRWTSAMLAGLELPVIGEIDLEFGGGLCEEKTKWPYPKASAKLGFSMNSLPAKPDDSHVAQCAVYWNWLRQQGDDVPIWLVYANCKAYRVFSSADCEALQPSSLDAALDKYRAIARKRERFLQMSETLEDLFTLIAPDFSDFRWRSVSPAYRAAAEEAFNV
jgi:hypothetical protein